MLSVRDIANRELLDLVPYEPGKPVDDVARELGLDPASIIKLASNENPLGPSPKAIEAMRGAIEKVHFYPDGGGFHLRNAIAQHLGLSRENVVLGNGSNEIIELLFHTFTRPGIHEIVSSRHAFAVYALMAQLFGVRTIEVDDVDFTPDLPAMLRAVTPQTRLIFLASPNNPTGTRVTNAALDEFLRALPPHVIAVLDEAYYEFLDDAPDTVARVRAGERIVLMRTFSKIQGLAGLRIGYGLASAEIADLLQRARQPFNANSIAQAGAIAGLADIDHQQKTKALTDEGRALLEKAFAQMGLKYAPSSANFVLVHVGDGGEVFKRLMKKGIIVRSMVSYRLPGYIRVSVGTPEQNARFLAELPGALEGLVAFTKPEAAPVPATLSPMNFGTVAILGPGLIGGSLALALAERSLAKRLVIYARSPHALDAIRLAGVDAELTGNPSEAVREADVVILCVPIEAMAALVTECRDAFKPDALVTDVGSVKGSVDAALAPLLKNRALWIGSHPMAGSEQSGFIAARPDLFENAAVILTPTPQTAPGALERAEQFWKALGARLYTMPPADHDLAVADISHVPHLLASLLVANANPKSLPLAGGGFRDTTRIASGSAELWTEILWANRDALARNCHAWSNQLAEIQRLFAGGDADAKSELFKLLENAQSVRLQLMDKKSFPPKSASTFRP